MSVIDCIGRLLKAGKITEKQAKEASAVYRGVFDGAFEGMDRASAEAYAAVKTAEILDASAKARKLELARSVTVYKTLNDRLAAHPNGALAGYMGMWDRDIRNAAGDRINVSSLEKEYYQPLIAQKMHEFDVAYRSKLMGLKQDTAGVRNMLRENFGVKTGDGVAAEASRGYQNMLKWSVDTAKKLGRIFDPTEEWRHPQWWTSSRANKFGPAVMKADLDREIAGRAVWIADDNGAMIKDTAARDEAVRKAVEDIRLDLNKTAGPGSVFKDTGRRIRFVQGEKGAEAYLRLMDKYGPGQGGFYNMIQGHAEKMARELAMLHVFGPKFRGTSQKLLDDAIEMNRRQKLDAPKANIFDRMGDTILRAGGLEGELAAKRMQKYMTGQLSGADSELAAGIMQGARSFMTATNMGSAIVTAIPADTVNWLMAGGYRGLSGGRLVQSVTDYFLHDNPDKEAFAARLGITAHAASRIAIGTKQYGDQLLGGGALGAMKGMADFTIRAQGLHAWDNAINRAFTMEFLASLADRQGKAFGDLDKPFAGFLKDYGFNEADWAKLSAADHIAVGPAKWLKPDSLDDGMRAKLMSAIGDEKQFAYLAGGSNRVRSLATGGVKAGSFVGEASRSFFLFKQFPLTLVATHGVRSMQALRNGQWGQIAQLGLFMTIAGAISMQAKSVLQGKDPRDMNPLNDGDFWLQAAAQGGALGIYGDFLKSGMSRSDNSLLETVVGPMAQIPEALGRLTSSAYRESVDGTKTNYGAELAKDIQKFTPGGTLWYARLLANRFLHDNIRSAMDSNYASAFARQKEQLQKQTGQDFWWGPGESLPSRPPQF